MKVSAEGSGRKVGPPHKFIDAELNKFDESGHALCMWDEATGGARISFSTSKKIELNGKYDFVIELTREEIAKIFYQTFRHDSVESAVILMEPGKRWPQL